MNFEEFCKYTELTKLNSDVSLSGREFMKIAWSHQQEKIDYWKREAIGDFSESKDFVRHINIAERQIKDLKEFYKELQAFCKELIEVVDYCVDNYSSDPLRGSGRRCRRTPILQW